jgi:chromate transporter
MPYLEILRVFLGLGVSSFGGPVAHIGYFHDEFVLRRRWVSQAQFSGWLAICQALPGPASSQLGFLIGWHRGGLGGALLAWVGFTLPSALVLVLLALYGLTLDADWVTLLVQGLKLVAVVVVGQAIWSMFRSLCQQVTTQLLAVLGFAMSLALGGWLGQIGAIVAGGLIALAFYRPKLSDLNTESLLNHAPSRTVGVVLLGILLSLLLVLPWLAGAAPALVLFDSFYRAGALVFGGGHVVLPLLETATVSTGAVSADAFVTGYGLVQAVPGPLFTFAAWLGALDANLPGWWGASVALVAVFLPGILLVVGIMPFWQAIHRGRKTMAALAGINAAVVGVLASAWLDPIVTTSVNGFIDLAIVAVGAGMLVWRKYPVWAVVIALPLLAILADWVGL